MLPDKLRAFLGAVASVLIAGCLVASPASAQPFSKTVDSPGFTFTKPVVVDAHGRRIPVTLVADQTGPVDTASGSENYSSVTWGVGKKLDSPTVIQPNGSGQGPCEQSGSFTVEICLTQYWNDYYDNGYRYVEVDYYTVQFNRLDTAWALNSGQIRAGVLGPCGTGCSGTLNNAKTQNYGTPTSGHTYFFTPPWAGKYVRVSPSTYQCANSSLVYSRGTDVLKFNHSNVCQGSPPPSGF